MDSNPSQRQNISNNPEEQEQSSSFDYPSSINGSVFSQALRNNLDQSSIDNSSSLVQPENYNFDQSIYNSSQPSFGKGSILQRNKIDKFQNEDDNQSMSTILQQSNESQDILNQTIIQIEDHLIREEIQSSYIHENESEINSNIGTLDTTPSERYIMDESVEKYVYLREYQYQIYKSIEKQWFSDQEGQYNPYGSIIFMATGSGKTFIAIMLILRIFELDNEKLQKYTEKEKKEKKDIQLTKYSKKVIFMVPTTNLVEQQAEAINSFTPLKVGKYSGNHQKSQKSNPGKLQMENWKNQLESFDVFVFTEKKLYDTLMHGFLKLEEFDMVVFDECHHADQSHYYNLIMQDFFYFKKNRLYPKPRILGLTASPIKSKIGDSDQRNIQSDIKEKLQNLSNNLYSQFVFISLEQIHQLEKQQAQVLIEKFDFDIKEKVNNIQLIVKQLIEPLCRLMQIDVDKLKFEQKGKQYIQNSDPSLESRRLTEQMNIDEQLNLTIESIVFKVCEREQDQAAINFIKQRSDLIGYDIKYIKTNIHIQSFSDKNDQILMIFNIVILKNANNLILELGSYSFMNFLKDQKDSLLSNLKPNISKTINSNSILDQFSLYEEDATELQKVKSVSNKVKKLIKLLNKEVEDNRDPPKVIIFVKDRVVAEYLKRNLQKQIEMKKMPEYSKTKGLLNIKYSVECAMGPQGRNLVNKAYRSTKGNDTLADTDDSIEESKLYEEISINNLSANSETISQNIKQFRRHALGGNTNVTTNGNNVKMSNNQLKEILSRFKNGNVNILIATNVVEEGLDVSECNLVICMNEMMNVKAFIQMKGRARQKDSKFIFLSAHQEYEEVEKDKKNFGVVIEKMKELAFGKDSIGGIEPESNIIEQKVVSETEYFQIKETGAKVSMRDAKSLLDTFCKAAADIQPNLAIATPKDEDGKIKKYSKYVQDYDPFYKTTETDTENNKKFFVTCIYLPKTCAVFCNYQFRVMPLEGFLKKKDAENHIALVTIKKLYQNDHFDEYLFPKIGAWVDRNLLKGLPKQSQPQNPPKKKQISDNQSQSNGGTKIQQQNNQSQNQRRRAYITTEESEIFKNEQKEFEKELKTNRSRIFETVEESFRSLIKEKLFQEKKGDQYQEQIDYNVKASPFPKIYIHCLKGNENDSLKNNFPFKTTTDHLGIIFDRKFDQTNSIRFWMFQEKKQKEKNNEYLSQLMENDIIEDDTYETLFQRNEMIELELNKKNLIEIDLKKYNKEEAILRIQKLKFFHTWVFYYFYCADHKLIKNIFKNKFTFVRSLFGEQLKMIYKREDLSKIVKEVYVNNQKQYDEQSKLNFQTKYQQSLQNTFYPDKVMMEIYPFIVPLINQKGQLQVNWKLIDKVIQYQQNKIYDIIFCRVAKEALFRSIDIERFIKFDEESNIKTMKGSLYSKDRDMVGIWDDRFTGVRYVKLKQFWSSQKWDAPILHLENRQGAAQMQNSIMNISITTQKTLISNFEPIIETSTYVSKSDQNNSLELNHTIKEQVISKRDQRLDIFTVQQYNFEKYGYFLNEKLNPKLYIVRKERHFVDFSKTPKQEEYDKSNTSQAVRDKMMEDPQFRKQHQLSLQTGSQSISSKFDIPSELLMRCPLSYSQYQVFQQACTHLLYFNEFLQVEKFISDKFKDLKCFLEVRDEEEIMKIKDKQVSSDLSIDQKISQQKENLQSQMKPAKISRNVFMSPIDTHDNLGGNIKQVLAENQLLNNVDLMMQALTAPNANRNYDYERLEFYGDSVISFLVILELFLTKNYEYKEGPLDFYRIQQVSNMKFYKINLEHKFFKYMINEPQTIFNDFVPGAFDNLKYQERIKHKTLNELNNKVKELKKQEQIFKCKKITNNHQIMFQLRKYYYTNGFENRSIRSFSEDQIFTNTNDKSISDKDLVKLYLRKLNQCINKIQCQKTNKIEEIKTNQKKNKSKRQTHQKMFFFKQLADVVESVTGAATVACGLNLTQNYLKRIGVLQFEQNVLSDSLKELKRRKSLNIDTQAFVNSKMNDPALGMDQVEKKLGYTFKNKLWMIEALTHKSYIDQNQQVYEQIDQTVDMEYGNYEGAPRQEPNSELLPTDDYERLEFLGDAILNFLIAEHFYVETVNDQEKKMPKELHKMKTSVINNALLSLIVIEKGIDQHVLYNNKAISFRDQFNNYVSKVKELLNGIGGSTKGSSTALEIDQLYEYNLKIFGDVFESLIGAVFIDSECIEKTWSVLHGLMEPYIKIYADLDTLQDHSRTKLLELWNQKPFMRNLKCHHETQKKESNEPPFGYDGTIIFKGMVDEICVLEVPYNKDAKNKVRSFYKKYYELIKGFFDEFEKKENSQDMYLSKEQIINKIKIFQKKMSDQKIENE